jgi:hypothetical protein
LLGLVLLVPLAAPLDGQQQDHVRSGVASVRYSEGTAHGFLELRSNNDSLIAFGDLLQVPGDSGIESRMVFRFADGSTFEETTEFTQHQAFRMTSYHLVQHGPAFDADLDASLSAGGHYVVKSTSHKDKKAETFEGRLDLPEDTYNGLPVILAKNLRSGDTARVHLVAFTPKPQLIGLQISFVGTDSATLGSRTLATAHYVLKPQLGPLKAFFAKLLGKLPPDSHIWIITEDVPAFLRFEGPMYMGPVWRLSQTMPRPPTSSSH